MHAHNLDLFDALSIYDYVSPRACRALDGIGTTLDLADRTVIEREGRDCAQLIIVLRGSAAVTAGGDLQEMLIRGDVWGDGGVSGAAASRTLVAMSRLRIHAFSKREFRALQDLLPALGQRLLRTGTATAGLGGPRPKVPPTSRCEQAAVQAEKLRT